MQCNENENLEHSVIWGDLSQQVTNGFHPKQMGTSESTAETLEVHGTGLGAPETVGRV